MNLFKWLLVTWCLLNAFQSWLIARNVAPCLSRDLVLISGGVMFGVALFLLSIASARAADVEPSPSKYVSVECYSAGRLIYRGKSNSVDMDARLTTFNEWPSGRFVMISGAQCVGIAPKGKRCGGVCQ